MSDPPPAKPNLRERLRNWFKPSGQDVIVANIGAGAQDVVVGKNIVKIGTLVFPTIPLIATVVGLLLLTSLALWFALVPATMPAATFNVAIAEFGVSDSRGVHGPTSDTQRLSAEMYATVNSYLSATSQSPSQRGVTVWHDSMNFLQKRTAIGVIPADQRSAACNRAEQLGADLVVYGTLDRSVQPALLRLSFCARTNRASTRDQGIFEEVQRTDRLGGPLQVDLPVLGGSNAARTTRNALAARLIQGLRQELDVNDLQQNVRSALATFQQAKQLLLDSNSTDGLDLVDYLIGREHFFLFQDSATPAAEKPQHLIAAQQAFTAALSATPPRVRALIGLAATQYWQVQSLPPEQWTDLGAIEAASATGERAIATAAAIDAPDAESELEARITMALIQQLKAQVLLRMEPPDHAAALRALQRADAEAALVLDHATAEQNRSRAVALMARGVAAQVQAQILLRQQQIPDARALFERAAEQYRACIAVADRDRGDLFVQRQIKDANCVVFLQRVEDALNRL